MNDHSKSIFYWILILMTLISVMISISAPFSGVLQAKGILVKNENQYQKTLQINYFLLFHITGRLGNIK